MKKAPTPVSQASVIELLQRTDLAHWQDIVKRIDDPVTARLIVKLLDDDPHLREHRIGVYLAASETVKRSQMRFARWQRRRDAAVACLRFARGCVMRVVGAVTSIRPPMDLMSAAAISTALAAGHEANGETHVAPAFPPIVDPFVGTTPLVH